MTYLPGQPPQQGQNNPKNQQNDPRAYQYRPIMPNVRVDPILTNAPTLGQYVRSDTRGLPGGKKQKWAGRLAFWLGLVSIPMLFILGAAFEIHAFFWVAAAFSVVAIFFGLVAFVAGIGRGLGFFGIVFALIGNIYVISWLDTVFNG